jgi:hypothetical protein
MGQLWCAMPSWRVTHCSSRSAQPRDSSPGMAHAYSMGRLPVPARLCSSCTFHRASFAYAFWAESRLHGSFPACVTACYSASGLLCSGRAALVTPALAMAQASDWPCKPWRCGCTACNVCCHLRLRGVGSHAHLSLPLHAHLCCRSRQLVLAQMCADVGKCQGLKWRQCGSLQA